MDGGDLARNAADAGAGAGVRETVVIGSGPCAGRSGYACAGTVHLAVFSDGREAVALEGDFSVSDVPGPRLVLTARDSLSGAIDAQAGDLDLGTLQERSGPGRYPLAAGDGGRRTIFVFSALLGIEAGRAVLADSLP